MTGHWALVIGINNYSDCKENLKGCVNDAKLMKEYFELSLGNELNVIALTASLPAVIEGPPSEPQESWPTCDNTIACLDQISQTAKSGDRVLIYYAGHGTQIEKSSTHALVLLCNNGREKQYLRLNSLYKRVEMMITNGINVTLILDCCFSGAIVRGDDEVYAKIRCLDFDPSIPFSTAEEVVFTVAADEDFTRDAAMQPDWAEYAKGLMVLCACAPKERAYETQLHGESHGLFTYHLLKALNLLASSGVSITHSAVHERISTSLHAHWSQQTPMRYGKTDDVLFGESLLVPEGNYFAAYKDKNGCLRLRAGTIHGIAVGDEFHAVPVETENPTRDSQPKEKIANMRATAVSSFESDLEEIEERCKRHTSRKWEVEPLTSLSSDVILIAVPRDIAKEIRLQYKGPLRYLRFVEQQESTQGQSSESCDYTVLAVAQDQVEIANAMSEKIQSIPAIQGDSENLGSRIGRVLRHIAEFKYFEGLVNRIPSPDFQATYSIRCTRSAENSNRIDMLHSETITFEFENSGSEQLYIGIFDFTPLWQMAALTPAFKILRPRDKPLKINMRMEMPQLLEGKGWMHCEDHIKFIITNRATHFRWSLPTISKTLSGDTGDHRDDDGGLHVSLATFIGELRGQDGSNWATKSFLIRTSRRLDISI